MKKFLGLAVACGLVLWSISGLPSAPSADPSALKITEVTAVRGGLAVHLGTTDGRLEADLAASGKLLVHGIALDDTSLKQARTTIRSKGLYGLAAVARRDSLVKLPYGDNLVNLLTADLDGLRDKAPEEAEILRVLVPRGQAYLKKAGQWVTLKKPRAANLDDWTHFDYGPEGNSVSNDRQVGPATAIKWLDGYQWFSYTHRESSGFRSENGVLIHEFRFDKQGNYFLARDGHNGLVAWHANRGTAEDGLPMVLVGGTLYTHLTPAKGTASPLVALDAATGKVLRTFDQASSIEPAGKGRESNKRVRLLALGGLLYQIAGSSIIALDPKTGEVKWKYTDERNLLFGVGSANEKKLFAVVESANAKSGWSRWPSSDADAIVCIDAGAGKQIWRNSDVSGKTIGQLVYDQGTLAFFNPIGIGAGPKEKALAGALRAQDGKLLWMKDYAQEPQFTANWGFLFAGFLRDQQLYLVNQQAAFVFDSQNGELTTAFKPRSVNNRCVRPRATEEYLLIGFGLFADRKFNWTFQNVGRSDCATGLFPANGMTYQTPNDCHCYAQLRGFAGYATEADPAPVADEQRLERGDGKPLPLAAEERKVGQKGDAVPTVMAQDGLRKIGPTPIRVIKVSASPIRDSWQNNDGLPFPETEPLRLGQRAYVAVVNEHRLEAREGDEVMWSFTAESRISSPPVVHVGQVYFGAHDGFVYCLDEKTGGLKWRFLAAPAQRWMIAFGQLESAAPVLNVVLHQGDLCCAAGRHPELDGGLIVWRLEPATGKIKEKKALRRAVEWVPADAKQFAGLQNFIINDPLRVIDGKLMLYGQDVSTLTSPTRIYKTHVPLMPYAEGK